MKLNNIANFDNIDDYVEAKLAEYSAREKSFETLFEFMFSEKNNVMAEFSDGYRIKKQTYGSVVRGYNSTETVSQYMMDALLAGLQPYALVDTAADASYEEMCRRLQTLDEENSCIAIIDPI